MAKEPRPIDELTIWDDAKAMLKKARAEGIQTVHDRLDRQTPHCKFCELGTTCRNCTMGPCRVSEKNPLGVCGADADVIVARNFGRFVTGGAAGHSDHGRDLIEVLEAIVEGETTDYKITEENKLRAIAGEVGISTDGRPTMDVARDVMECFFADFGSRKKEVSFLSRVPQVRKD
ncbi:MAG TPA: carbon monoxide dehydrogenase, partial [Pseudodesulfovibrio sp.]|nr:carbon monoxide dehydrogenase [Pseudodesulfovibrio sp.]